MRYIDDHAQFIHALHYLDAKWLETFLMYLGIVAARIADRIFIAPEKRQQSDAHIVHLFHSFHFAVNKNTVFHGQKSR